MRALCKRLWMLGLYLITTGLKHGVCIMDRSMVSSFYEFLAHSVVILPMSNPSAYPKPAVLNAASLEHEQGQEGRNTAAIREPS